MCTTTVEERIGLLLKGLLVMEETCTQAYHSSSVDYSTASFRISFQSLLLLPAKELFQLGSDAPPVMESPYPPIRRTRPRRQLLASIRKWWRSIGPLRPETVDFYRWGTSMHGSLAAGSDKSWVKCPNMNIRKSRSLSNLRWGNGWKHCRLISVPSSSRLRTACSIWRKYSSILQCDDVVVKK